MLPDLPLTSRSCRAVLLTPIAALVGANRVGGASIDEGVLVVGARHRSADYAARRTSQ